MVEHNLAKVGVAGPSPVFRSRGGQKETPIESKKPCISMICKAFLPPSTTSVEAKGSGHFIHSSYLSSSGLSPYPYAAPDRTERRNRFFRYRLYKAEAGQLINHIAAGCPASILTAGCITWHNIPYKSGMLPYHFDIQPQSVKTAHSPMKSLRPFHPAGLPLLQTRRPQLCSAEVWNG